MNALKTYSVCLNCSSKFHIDNAKSFEIISAGSILFTDECYDNGFIELFGEDGFVTYKPDMSNLVSQARKVLLDKPFRKHIVETGLKTIATKHTHKVRGEQLIKIIKSL